jgi:hypothetical protein
MQKQPNPTPPTDDADELQRVIMHVLLGDRSRGLWSEAELAQLIGSAPDVAFALVELHAAALVHRCHEFVFATRAAVRFSELEQAA